MAREKDRIFISYRRSDAPGSTTAIRKTFLDRFGEQAVFRDVDGIDPGAEFPQKLRAELERAAVVLAVIGKGWLSAANEWGQRRIDFDDDWVNIELRLALADPEVTVIPVLVDDAVMPPARALPQSLKELSTRNAAILRHDAWDETARPLLDKVTRLLSPDDALLSSGAPEALTADLIRQTVAEALGSVIQPAGLVLLSTVDDISRLVAAIKELRPDEKATLELLLRRLLGRPVVEVSGYVQEVLRSTFSHITSEGKWLGYALDSERDQWSREFRGCVLLLPDPDARVSGTAAVARIDYDYYGAHTNDPPGPIVSASSPLVQVGHPYGEVVSS